MAQQWALVTGVSAHGLGDALTRELLSKNINVVATALDMAQLDYLDSAEHHSAKLERLELDVTSPFSISTAATAAQHITNGRLDFLVNNAGYGYMMPLMDARIEEVKKNFDVNVFGLLAVTQAFFPLLRAAKGTVVNQASIAGLPGIYQPFIGSYSASKGAVIDLSNTMRVELAPFGIKVAILVTGDVRTGFWDHAQGGHIGISDSSPYFLIKDKVDAVLTGKTNPPGQHSAERWAKAVVGDLLKSRQPSKLYRGYLATTMSWVSWLTPSWLLDWLFSQTTDLARLGAELKKVEEGKKVQ